MKKKLIFLFLLCYYVNSELSCINNAGHKVKWFIIFKIPGPFPNPGFEYYYLDSLMISNGESMSYHADIRESALTNTLQQYYDTKEDNDVGKFIYNDQNYLIDKEGNPVIDEKGKQVKKVHHHGHMKGVLNFDGEGGYFITHSFPCLPNINDNILPESSLVFGQHAVCMNVQEGHRDILSQYFFMAHPTILIDHIPSQFLDDFWENVLTKPDGKFRGSSDGHLHTLNLPKIADDLKFNIHVVIHPGGKVDDVDEDYVGMHPDDTFETIFSPVPWDELADAFVTDYSTPAEEKENVETIIKEKEAKSIEADSNEKNSVERHSFEAKSIEAKSTETEPNEEEEDSETENQSVNEPEEENNSETENDKMVIIVQSWRFNCYKKKDHYVRNIGEIKPLKPGAPSSWSTTIDHSKYGFLREYKSETDKFVYHVFCLGDLNHVKTLNMRGGGIFCTANPKVINAITETLTFTTTKAVKLRKSKRRRN